VLPAGAAGNEDRSHDGAARGIARLHEIASFKHRPRIPRAFQRFFAMEKKVSRSGVPVNSGAQIYRPLSPSL
jgi:hypothetical protein